MHVYFYIFYMYAYVYMYMHTHMYIDWVDLCNCMDWWLAKYKIIVLI